MLTNLGDFLSVASTVLVIASFAGVGLMRARVINLRESLEDARGEIADKDRRISDLEASRKADRVELDRQSHDLDALKRVVTGETHWVAISDKLEEHHAAAVVHWEADEELLGRVLQAIERKP